MVEQAAANNNNGRWLTHLLWIITEIPNPIWDINLPFWTLWNLISCHRDSWACARSLDWSFGWLYINSVTILLSRILFFCKDYLYQFWLSLNVAITVLKKRIQRMDGWLQVTAASSRGRVVLACYWPPGL